MDLGDITQSPTLIENAAGELRAEVKGMRGRAGIKICSGRSGARVACTFRAGRGELMRFGGEKYFESP